MLKHLLTAGLIFFSLIANAQTYQCKWQAKQEKGGQFQPFSYGPNEFISVEKTSTTLKFNDYVYSKPEQKNLPNGTLRTDYYRVQNGIAWLASFAVSPNGQVQLALTDSKTESTIAGICVQK